MPDVVTQFGGFKLNLTGASESFDFGLKLSDIVALRFTGAVRAIVGTNIPSIVYEGATYDLGAGLQVPIRLFRLQSSGSQLALVPYFSFSSGQATTLFPLLRNGAGATLQTFLVGNGGELAATPFDAVRFGLNAAFAQTFSPNFSLQAGAGVGRTVVTIKPFSPTAGDTTERYRRSVGVQFRRFFCRRCGTQRLSLGRNVRVAHDAAASGDEPHRESGIRHVAHPCAGRVLLRSSRPAVRRGGRARARAERRANRYRHIRKS